jgi:glycosyltransferase involved in cell wall biosynthesis
MRVLFLAHLLPFPADSGGKIRTSGNLEALVRRHDVRLVGFLRTSDEERELPRLRGMCVGVDVVPLRRTPFTQVRDLASSLILGRSFVVSRDFRREMLELVRAVVDEFRPDVVHIDHLQMAQFVDFDAPYRTVLDHHNVESMIVKRLRETSGSIGIRLYASLEWPRLKQYELSVCRKCDAVITVSEEDKTTLQAMDPTLGNVHSVPIGVDVDSTPIIERKIGSRNILFLGTMHWPPNIDCVHYFYRDIFPLVKAELPDCTLTVAGQRPPRSIEALARDPAVRVTGYVSDAAVCAKDCGVFIVPLRSGSGVRVKILNALAMGLPVVSTSVGAEGIEAEHGAHLLIADTPKDFAHAVVSVLRDPDLADQIGRNGRALVSAKYSWKATGDELLSVYEDYLVGTHAA